MNKIVIILKSIIINLCPIIDLTIVINTFNSDEKIFSCLESINPNLNSNYHRKF